jgi:hypothetical protein
VLNLALAALNLALEEVLPELSGRNFASSESPELVSSVPSAVT